MCFQCLFNGISTFKNYLAHPIPSKQDWVPIWYDTLHIHIQCVDRFQRKLILFAEDDVAYFLEIHSKWVPYKQIQVVKS